MENLINFQNSMIYDVIRNIFAYIFYILLIIWIFYKIYTTYFIKKMNCKNEYLETKTELLKKLKEEKKGKVIGKILITILIICVCFFVITLILNIFILIFTGVGIVINDNPILATLKKIVDFSVFVLEYIPIIIWIAIFILIYTAIYSFFIKGIYINKNFIKEKLKKSK